MLVYWLRSLLSPHVGDMLRCLTADTSCIHHRAVVRRGVEPRSTDRKSVELTDILTDHIDSEIMYNIRIYFIIVFKELSFVLRCKYTTFFRI